MQKAPRAAATETRKFAPRLGALLCALVVTLAACRAESDPPQSCYQSKLGAVRWGASRLLECAGLRDPAGERARRCVDQARRRIRTMLHSADAAAAARGYVCPANAEQLGLQGAATWPHDIFQEFVGDDAAASLHCARRRARAMAGYVSAYAQCRAGVYDEDSVDAASCAEREQRYCELIWSDTVAGGCRADLAAADVVDRIAAEVEADAARLRVRCGDGRREGFETCDDGNRTPNDGCSEDCRSETCTRVGQDVRCLVCPADSEPDDSGRSCRCPKGFSGEPGECRDIDECSKASCPEDRPCVNTPGLYSCAIPCSEQALEEAIASCGAPTGTITFDCGDTVIPIAQASGTHPRRVDCDGLVIDGLDRNVSFEMDPLCWRMPVAADQCAVPLEADGTCACPDIDNGTTFMVLAGTRDVVRNISVTGFFDGIRTVGTGDIVENVRFDRMCDDAFGSVGAGVGNIFRNLVASDGCDKCAQSTGDIALTDRDPRVGNHYNAIFSNIDLIGCHTPLRMAQGGRFRIEDVRMSLGPDPAFPCDGPRFSGTAPDGLVIEMQRSSVSQCRHGVRFGRNATGILNDNTISGCSLRGIWAGGSAMVSLSSNHVRSNGGKGSSESGFGGVAAVGLAKVDLGGGGLQIDGSVVISPGGNDLCDNVAPDGSRRDVDNGTANVLAAQNNWWCTKESPAGRVNGLVDVVPSLTRIP